MEVEGQLFEVTNGAFEVVVGHFGRGSHWRLHSSCVREHIGSRLRQLHKVAVAGNNALHWAMLTPTSSIQC